MTVTSLNLIILIRVLHAVSLLLLWGRCSFTCFLVTDNQNSFMVHRGSHIILLSIVLWCSHRLARFWSQHIRRKKHSTIASIVSTVNYCRSKVEFECRFTRYQMDGLFAPIVEHVLINAIVRSWCLNHGHLFGYISRSCENGIFVTYVHKSVSGTVLIQGIMTPFYSLLSSFLAFESSIGRMSRPLPTKHMPLPRDCATVANLDT